MLKDLFKSDQTCHAERVESLKADIAALKPAFVEAAGKAGFTEAQAEFMWVFLSHSQHQHEYYYDLHTWITAVPITDQTTPGYQPKDRWPSLSRWFKPVPQPPPAAPVRKPDPDPKNYPKIHGLP